MDKLIQPKERWAGAKKNMIKWVGCSECLERTRTNQTKENAFCNFLSNCQTAATGQSCTVFDKLWPTDAACWGWSVADKGRLEDRMKFLLWQLDRIGNKKRPRIIVSVSIALHFWLLRCVLQCSINFTPCPMSSQYLWASPPQVQHSVRTAQVIAQPDVLSSPYFVGMGNGALFCSGCTFEIQCSSHLFPPLLGPLLHILCGWNPQRERGEVNN